MAAETHLPEDIIFDEILPRIPAKTLLKFKLVSRQWNSVISSPAFAKSQVHHPSYLSSNSVLTLNTSFTLLEAVDYGDSNTVALTQFPMEFSDPFFRLISSCNGLALFISSATPQPKRRTKVDLCPLTRLRLVDFRFVVYNPVLGPRSSVEISHPRRPHPNEYFNFGFGYVSSLGEYYIVTIDLPLNKNCEPDLVIWVYKLRSQQWEEPKIYKHDTYPFRFRQAWYTRAGTLVKETLHWSVTLGYHTKECIATFNLATQDGIQFMELPGGDNSPALCNLNDCLGAYSNEDIWIMREYGAWERLFRLNLSGENIRNFFGFTKAGMGLAVISGGVLKLVDCTGDVPQFTDIEIVDKGQHVNYVQSLVSPR